MGKDWGKAYMKHRSTWVSECGVSLPGGSTPPEDKGYETEFGGCDFGGC